MKEKLSFIADVSGERLDVFLSRQFQDKSRSSIQKLIETGAVFVETTARKANYKLSIGDSVSVELPEPKQLEILPEEIPLKILYEDSDIIVINKEQGMVVHPATGIVTGTLVNALLYHCKDLSGINGVLRPGIVHRLDKDTSGVMVCAKNDVAHLSLAQQIKEKTAHRIYKALVFGNIKEDTGIIHGDIGRSLKDRQKMAIVSKNGKPATTKFKVIERFGKYTLVECRLMTGRTHQIRVHMTSIGHPLVGDFKYGTGKNPFKMLGQALHSEKLVLFHPRTGKEMFFEAPIPDYMQKVIKVLKNKRGDFYDNDSR